MRFFLRGIFYLIYLFLYDAQNGFLVPSLVEDVASTVEVN